ncbi:sugar nucleotide-binding protein, partial [Bordetella pertussis]
VSWHGLACHIVARARRAGLALSLDPAHIRPVTAAQYPLPAPRPANSRLDCGALRDALEPELPDWQVDLDAVVDALAARAHTL